MKRREQRKAEQRAALRLVYMQFTWAGNHSRVTFRPSGADIVLPRTLRFADADKLRDLFRRFGTSKLSEDVAALEFAIRTGGGAVELTSGEEQLGKLRRPMLPTLNTEGRI